ncbi:MAG TPA: DUF222 domain-containing protein [Streptosporangiaceae bacterium]
MTSQAVPFTAEEAARQEAILAAEIAAGWLTPPPEDWQLPGPEGDLPPDAGDPGPGEPPWLTGDRPATAPAPNWTALPPPGMAAGAGGPQPAAASAGAPEPAEVLPCGIVAHDPAGPGGPGFASGSALDCLEPGPVLTAALDDTDAAGLTSLNDDELAGMILAWRRTESHAAAGLLTATAELARRRAACPGPHAGEHAADELAILLTMTGRAAAGLLGQAAALARLPATRAALRTGQIDRSRAAVIGYETELLSDDDAAQVEQQVIGKAPRQTTSRLRSRARAAVMAADPGAMRRRKEKAAKQARVELQPELSGNAQLSGRELPPDAALAANARIDACARSLKANGVKAKLPQLRAAVFLALLTGTDPRTFLPDPGTDASTSTAPDSSQPGGRPCAAAPAPPGPPAPAGTCGAGPADSSSPAGTDSTDPETAHTDGEPCWPAVPAGLEINGTVHLTVPLTTWLGLTDAPSETAGYGAADGDTSRAIADSIAASPRSSWCLTITDPAGRAIAHACARRPPPASPADRAAWLKTLTITRIETGTCTHAREVPGYRIPASLHHIVKTRQRTCSAPCCTRPAAQCDTDHTLAYDDGGRTCECGLAPLCRKHHQAKQTQGWHLEQPEPGILVWQLPHGRSYTATPSEYPV